MEDTLFQVPRENLEQSEVFKGMFELPIGEHDKADGRSDAQPLLLEGVSVTEFRSFLMLLLPRYVLHSTTSGRNLVYLILRRSEGSSGRSHAQEAQFDVYCSNYRVVSLEALKRW